MKLFLIILASVLTIITLILFLTVKIVIQYENEPLIYAKILLIKYRLFPKRKKKVALRKYTPYAMRKKERRESKKNKKKNIKPKKNKTDSKPKKQKTTLENIHFIRFIIAKTFDKFFRYLKIDLAKIFIIVGGEDAAQVAIAYGAICGAVSNLCTLLCQISNFTVKKSSEIIVKPDFTASKTKCEIRITFRLRIWQILSVLVKVMISYLNGDKKT